MSARVKPKILLTGLPGCGKTTLIKKFAREVRLPICGFFTQEIKQKGQRVGFEVETFSPASQKAILSHIDIDSNHRVGKYRVDMDSFEQIAVPALEQGLKGDKIVIVDEIGKMELFSERFKALLIDLFSRDLPLLATIMLKSQPFCYKLKNSPDVKTLTLSQPNRSRILGKLVNIYRDSPVN